MSVSIKTIGGRAVILRYSPVENESLYYNDLITVLIYGTWVGYFLLDVFR